MVFNHSHDPRSLSSAVEAQAVAEKMLGSNLITKQTTEEGQPCGKVLFKLTNDFFSHFYYCAYQVLMVERLYLRRELYLSILLDRETGGPMMVASTAGGMDIEDVAEQTPQKILKVVYISKKENVILMTKEIHTCCMGLAGTN